MKKNSAIILGMLISNICFAGITVTNTNANDANAVLQKMGVPIKTMNINNQQQNNNQQNNQDFQNQQQGITPAQINKAPNENDKLLDSQGQEVKKQHEQVQKVDYIKKDYIEYEFGKRNPAPGNYNNSTLKYYEEQGKIKEQTDAFKVLLTR